MKYNPPPGSQDLNAPYVNGIPGVQKGSPVNANAMEYPQREILNVITAAGLTPTNNDLTQLLQAIHNLGPDTSQFVPVSRKINTAAPLTGGGDLGQDRTVGIAQATAATATTDGTPGTAIYANDGDRASRNKAATPYTVFSQAPGTNQEWQTLVDAKAGITGSRVNDVVYQNTTGRTIYALVCSSGGTGAYQGAFVGPTSSNLPLISQIGIANGFYSVFLIIPDGWYYKIGTVPGTSMADLQRWSELR